MANGEIKKVAACKVKPYKLIERNTEADCKCVKEKKRVMLEDGLEDIENLMSLEKEEKREAMKTADAESDAVGTNFLKIENSEAFSPFSIYTIEVPVSEHGTQEVKDAKIAEINNLIDYDVIRK